MSASQIAIPCIVMRGGTSKGPYFMAKDLPSDSAQRDSVLLAAMGSPDARQIDGLGGATTLTSKVAIVSPSKRPGIDVDYLFAQVEIEAARVDTTPPCGNMMAGVGPFALETGMVKPQGDGCRVAAWGLPDAPQFDGLGGATTLTSKVAIVSPSKRPGIDVDYLFAQVEIEAARVDTTPPCGNMMAGVGPFALETGMVKPQGDVSRVRIYHVNIDAKVEAVVQTPGGVVSYDGDTAIDGVPGTSAPVQMNFMDVAGSTCGKLLPTGNAIDIIEGIPVTCMDAAMPVMILAAESVGKTGYESPAEPDADKAMFQRIEKIRRIAGEKIGRAHV